MNASNVLSVLALLPLRKDGLLNKNDHIAYSVTGSVGDDKVEGALGIKIVAVKEGEILVDVLPKKVPFMKRARLKFPWDGKEMSDLGGVVAGWSVLHHGERVGRSTISTPFGDREVEHFMRIEELDNGTLKSEQFVDPVHHLPLGARMSGKSGDVVFGIVDTSLDWVKNNK
ncbi:MAG: hypothetical protein A4E31_00022 [Methanomassiliicoccales archaeon PtaU1.Bin030]|nr:MAG: hypothetical protein A4E31_00022 [Methanomassiliicoccales archaeon PtaU1.Bin030]